VAWDPNEYIHLTVTDQWEVYEHFYGQGQGQEIIRYLDGFNKVLDKHIDTGKPGELWVIPYNLETAECRRIDSLSVCHSDASDRLLEKGGEVDLSTDNRSAYVESPRLSDQLSHSQGGNTWYASLLDKLKG